MVVLVAPLSAGTPPKTYQVGCSAPFPCFIPNSEPKLLIEFKFLSRTED